MASLTKRIGIVSTITYSSTASRNNIKENFENGVNDSISGVTYATPSENVGYDQAALGRAVAAFSRDSAVGLIVTVGGLASAIAANNASYNPNNKPFLSLVGGIIPGVFDGNTATGNFYGGINLATFANNDKRVNHLTDPPHNHHADRICLLSNPLSAMATIETDAWRNSTPPRGRIFTARNNNEITQAFRDFGQDDTLRAMIISADPLFQDLKDELIAAANNLPNTKRVCYPLQIYANTGGGKHVPKSGHHTLHGPRLATAYFNLGKKAGKVIANAQRSTLDTITAADMEVHDG